MLSLLFNLFDTKHRRSKKSLEIVAFLTAFLCLIAIVKGGRGGGGGGGGRGGGRGGVRVGGGIVSSAGLGRLSGSVASAGGIKSDSHAIGGHKTSVRARRVGVIAAGGIAGYTAYRSYKSSHSKSKDRDQDLPDIEDTEYYYDYKLQERTGFNRDKSPGMSALGVILMVLGIIGAVTAAWCCCNIGVPCWRDWQSRRNRTQTFPHIIPSNIADEHNVPLRDSPTTTKSLN